MMIINKITFLLLLWMSISCIACNGQAKTNLPKENARIATGQPKLMKSQASRNIADNVHDILQDKKGNLWFATTADGVYRYDGTAFTNFTTKDGLNSNGVFSMVEDKKGNIWFGTTAGVSRYDGKTFTDLPLSSSTNNLVFSMLEDTSGRLWFGTNNGVYCYNGKTFTRFLDNPSLINRNGLNLTTVNQMIEDKHGNIWFTTKMEGVCRYDGKAIVKYTPKEETYFWGLLEDKNGHIWVGGRNKGVFRYDGKTFTNLLQNGRFDSYIASSIIQDKTGNIWFGTGAGDPSKRETEGGVWRYDGKTFKNFSTKDGLSHNGVWSLLEDNAGNIWVGTRNTGLFRFDGKTFIAFSE